MPINFLKKTNVQQSSVAPLATDVGGSQKPSVMDTYAAKLQPSQKLMDKARADQVLPGEKFAIVKKGLRSLWGSKGALVAGIVLGGGAVAAGLLHSQWLPAALHLATSPVGMGILAGVAGLALLAGGIYLGRQLTHSIKNARANNAKAIVKEEKAAAAAKLLEAQKKAKDDEVKKKMQEFHGTPAPPAVSKEQAQSKLEDEVVPPTKPQVSEDKTNRKQASKADVMTQDNADSVYHDPQEVSAKSAGSQGDELSKLNKTYGKKIAKEYRPPV